MSVEKFQSDSLTRFCKELVRETGGSLQCAFLVLLEDSQSFCRYLKATVRMEAGESPPLLDAQLAESDFASLPRDVEEKIFETWRDITPAEACHPSFWGLVTLRHIQAGIMESCFLASKASASLKGRDCIDHALFSESDEDRGRVVRTALRRFCGLKERRGHRSIFTDCVFARAWWRGRFCYQVCRNTDANRERVTSLFRVSQSYWETLIDSIISQTSKLTDMKIWDALVWALSEHIEQDYKSHLFHASTLHDILQLISRRSVWQELGVFSMDELKDMMEKEFIAAVR